MEEEARGRDGEGGRRAPAGIRGARPAGGCQKERGQPRGRRPGSQPRSAALVPAPNFLQPRGGTRRGVTGALHYGPRPARSAARPLTAAPRAGPPDTKAQPRPAAPALSARPRPRGRTWAAPPKFVHPGPSAAWAAPTNRWRGPEPPPAGRRGGGRNAGLRLPGPPALPCPALPAGRQHAAAVPAGKAEGERRGAGRGAAGRHSPTRRSSAGPAATAAPRRPHPAPGTNGRNMAAAAAGGAGGGAGARQHRLCPLRAGSRRHRCRRPPPPRAARPENGAGRERGVRGESRGFPKPERAGAGRRGGRA